MKYILIVTCALITLSFPKIAVCQKTFVSIGPELALTNSSTQPQNNKGTGLGGSIRLESSWSKHFSGLATLGFLSFRETHPLSTAPTYINQVDAMIIQLGVKYYIQEKEEYATGVFFREAGVMPTSTEITFTTGAKAKHKEGGISTALGTGYQWKK